MNAQGSPGYILTEVGVIPEDWTVEPLTNVSDKIMVGIASSATHAYRREGIPLLRNQNIKAGYLDDADVLYVDTEYESTFKNKRLAAGDLLIARTGYPGTTCVVPSKYESAQSFTTLIVRPDKSKVDSNYLCYYLNSEYGQNFFEQSQIGGAQKNVNAGSLKAMPVPVQPLPEQRAIAAALTDMDALISGLGQLTTKKRDIKQAAMQQLLTGKQRLPGFGGDWIVKSIKEIANVKGGKRLPLGESLVEAKTNHPYLRVTDMRYGGVEISDIKYVPDDVFPHIKNYRIYADDIFISVAGSLGIVGKIPAELDGANLTENANKITDISCDRDFLLYNLMSDRVQNIINSEKTVGAQPKLALGKIENFIISLPPEISEQTAIATILSDMDSELAILENRYDKARQLKQGMMQELLTGRVRLV